MPKVLRAGAYHAPATITMAPERVAWNRRGLNEQPSRSGGALRDAMVHQAVAGGMNGAGFRGCGLGGRGCDSTGAQTAQALLGASGAILSMYGAAQASSAKPTSETFTTVDGGKTVDIDSTAGTPYIAAGGVISAVSTSWGAACEARQDSSATSNLTLPPPIPPPVSAGPSQWISGVDNIMVVAGAALLLGGVLYMRR